MRDNVFTSPAFETTWQQHFIKGITPHSFDFLQGISFYRHKRLPLYTNIGRNHTKGMSFQLSETGSDFRNGVFLVYDVPDFFNQPLSPMPQGLGCHIVKQYPGYLINLEDYADLNDYMRKSFSKSGRYKLQKYRKRLEACFTISYRTYGDEMSRDTYNRIFAKFRELLEKRFAEKQIRNNNLDEAEWNFYTDVAYKLIGEKRANLFVILDGEEPIAITLNYLAEGLLIDAMTVFDIDYAKFHVGSVTIMKQIEWCLDHNYPVLDFSKGYFDYKKRWGNAVYDFKYLVFFDRKSITARTLASVITTYFRMKQWLRDRNVNQLVHKLSFRMQKNETDSPETVSFHMEDDANVLSPEEFRIVPRDSEACLLLRKPIFEFLYLNLEHQDNLQVFQHLKEQDTYVFKGLNKQVRIRL